MVKEYLQYFILGLSLLLLSNGCEKEIKLQADQQSFSKVYHDIIGGVTDIIETADGHVILVGYRTTDWETYTIFIMKTDEFGNEIWTQELESRHSLLNANPGPNKQITKMQAGNYLITSERSEQLVVINEQGTIIWDKDLDKDILLPQGLINSVFPAGAYISPIIQSDNSIVLATDFILTETSIFYKINFNTDQAEVLAEYHTPNWGNRAPKIIQITNSSITALVKTQAPKAGIRHLAVVEIDINTDSVLKKVVLSSPDRLTNEQGEFVFNGSSIFVISKEGSSQLGISTWENYFRNNNFGHKVYSLDLSLNRIWTKEISLREVLSVENSAVMVDAIPNSTDGFMLCGGIGVRGGLPFVIEANNNGNVIMKSSDLGKGAVKCMFRSKSADLFFGGENIIGIGADFTDIRWMLTRTGADGKL